MVPGRNDWPDQYGPHAETLPRAALPTGVTTNVLGLLRTVWAAHQQIGFELDGGCQPLIAELAGRTRSGRSAVIFRPRRAAEWNHDKVVGGLLQRFRGGVAGAKDGPDVVTDSHLYW